MSKPPILTPLATDEEIRYARVLIARHQQHHTGSTNPRIDAWVMTAVIEALRHTRA